MLYVEGGTVVLPGDLLAEKEDDIKIRGAYLDDSKLRAKYVGLFEVKEKEIKVTPLATGYIPNRGDIVIGKVIDIRHNSVIVSLNAPYLGTLHLNKIDKYEVGAFIRVKIKGINKRRGEIQLTTDGVKGPIIIRKGVVIRFNPSKIPRLIGKGGSMIKMISEKLGIRIVHSRNGYIWFIPPDEKTLRVVKEILEKIDRESHVPGLTDRVKKMLEAIK